MLTAFSPEVFKQRQEDHDSAETGSAHWRKAGAGPLEEAQLRYNAALFS